MRWLVGPFPRLQINGETLGYPAYLNRTNSNRWRLWAFVTGVSFPAPAKRPVAGSTPACTVRDRGPEWQAESMLSVRFLRFFNGDGRLTAIK